MPSGDGRDAAPKKAAVPIQVGLHGDVPFKVFDPGLPNALTTARGRQRGQMFEPDTFPFSVLVAVLPFVSHKGLLPNVLRQAVEPFAHGGLESLHLEEPEEVAL